MHACTIILGKIMANLLVKCVVVVLLLSIWLWNSDAQITIDGIDVQRVFPSTDPSASDNRYVVKHGAN